MAIILDILIASLLIYCMFTQYNWLKIHTNGARKTEKLWVFSLVTMLLLCCTNLARDIWHLNTFLNSFALQRCLFFVWAVTQTYFYLGRTFVQGKTLRKKQPNKHN